MLGPVYDTFVYSWYVTIPLALCSIASFVIIFDRLIWLRDQAVMPPPLAHAVRNLKYGGKITLIEQLASDESTPLARMVRACIMYTSWPKDENAQAIQSLARREIMRLEFGLVFLEIFTGVGPLLGLMGTIFGLIRIFGASSAAGDFSTQGAQIASGIAEAMYCTVAGLFVAIPAVIAYNLFSRRVESLTVQLESLCSELLGKLYSQPEAVGESLDVVA